MVSALPWFRRIGLLAAVIACVTLVAHGAHAEHLLSADSHCSLCQTSTAPSVASPQTLAPDFTVTDALALAPAPVEYQAVLLTQASRGPPSL